MLVISRKTFERIVMSNGVVVTVLGYRNGQVRLGIDAPENVRILREEIAVSELEKRNGTADGLRGA